MAVHLTHIIEAFDAGNVGEANAFKAQMDNVDTVYIKRYLENNSSKIFQVL